MQSPPDPTELLLRAIFRRVVGGVLAGSLLGLPGCATNASTGQQSSRHGSGLGRDPYGGGATTSDSRDSTCAQGVYAVYPNALAQCGKSWHATSRLRPRIAVDYLARRRVVPADREDTTIDAVGLPCRRARDAEACRAEVQRVATGVLGRVPVDTSDMYRSIDYLLTIKEDEVRAWVSAEQLVELLGDIDTEDEAMLVLRTQGHQVPCEEPELVAPIERVDGGFRVESIELSAEWGIVRRVRLVRADGSIRLVAETCIDVDYGEPTEGRRPPAFQADANASCTSLAEHFVTAARNEAASVEAFRALARELRAHRAPCALIATAERSAQDEVRHAEQMATLARRYGGRPRRVRVERQPVRSLEALALDNAVEGCVNETYSAALATYQARAAVEPAIASAMATIARDETRHAAFSLRLAAWLMPRLDDAARARVHAAQRRAVRELHAVRPRLDDPELRRLVGLPGPAGCARLVDGLTGPLWL